MLKDGASAVYGTDAIGGVINFILRNDFQGVEVNANYFGTQQGGGDNGRVNITAGLGDLAKDKYNVFISADYFKQQALKASQRESTGTSYIPSLGVDRTSSASFPANISQSGDTPGFSGAHNPTIPFPGGATPNSCAPPYSFPTARSPFACKFDFASTAETIPEAEQANIFGRAAWQINAENQFFVEGAYYYGKFIQRISPTPVNSSMALPPGSPYYPTAYVASLPGGDPTLPLDLLYRTIELGPRTDQAIVDQVNAVVGLQGAIRGWSYQLAANYTSNQQVDRYVSGYVYESKFEPLLRSGLINPFGPNTDAVLALMRATQVTGQANDNRASNYGASFTITNGGFDLPSGPVAVAFGVEARRESLEQTNADFVVSGDVAGGAGAVPTLTAAHRNVLSLFGEVNVPVVATSRSTSRYATTTTATLAARPTRRSRCDGDQRRQFCCVPPMAPASGHPRSPTCSCRNPSNPTNPVSWIRRAARSRGGLRLRRRHSPEGRWQSIASTGDLAADQCRSRSRATCRIVDERRLLLGQDQKCYQPRPYRGGPRSRLRNVGAGVCRA